MVNRNSSESFEHENLVRMMANYYTKQGYQNVKADIQGWFTPELIGKHIPDVTAQKNDLFIILEAETCTTIDDDHTKSQWLEFSKNGKFEVAVPKNCRDSANTQLRGLGITATVWTPQ